MPGIVIRKYSTTNYNTTTTKVLSPGLTLFRLNNMKP